jgi:hypothetical protein
MVESMTHHDDEQNTAGQPSGKYDLDAALAKYAAVKPRAGLEDRILATLRTERERPTGATWWRWTAAAVALAAIAVATALIWNAGDSGGNSRALAPSDHPLSTTSPPQVAANITGPSLRQQVPGVVREERKHGLHRQALAVAVAPKLDQFPSPQPLSEQERMLASYVATYPEHATLVARARAEALRRDAAEELKTGQASREDAQQQVR